MKYFIGTVLVAILTFAIGCQRHADSLPGVSAEEMLDRFDRVSFDSASQACAVIDNAAGSRRSVSFIDLKWSATSAMGKHRYAEFLARYHQQHGVDVASAHYVDCTPLTNDYSCLTNLPGWDRDQHRIIGNGEVVWMKNGRVVHVQEIGFGSADDLLAITSDLFHVETL